MCHNVVCCLIATPPKSSTFSTIAMLCAMAASLALTKMSRYLSLLSMLICDLNVFRFFNTPLKLFLLVHRIILLFFIFGIISITRQSCRKGKFKSDFRRFAWTAARSNAMAIFFAVSNIPRCCCLPINIDLCFKPVPHVDYDTSIRSCCWIDFSSSSVGTSWELGQESSVWILDVLL